jgi:hypothetical protein
MLNRHEITLKLMGGLGNQLFIATFAHLLAAEHPEKIVRLTLSEMPRQAHSSSILNLDRRSLFGELSQNVIYSQGNYALEIIATRLAPRLLTTIEEVGFSIEPTVWPNIRGYLRGYFQSNYYLEGLRFAGAPFLLRSVRATAEEKESLDQYSRESFTSVHARRGDYKNLQSTFGMLDIDYFSEAIKKSIGLGSKRFLLFSDEPDWWASQIPVLPKAEYEVVRGLDTESQLELLSKAENSIISNSTFAYWGAAGGAKKRHIIAPSPWFKTFPEPDLLLPKSNRLHLLPAKWN